MTPIFRILTVILAVISVVIPAVMLVVIPLTWVIFRITDLRDLGAYFSRLFPFFGSPGAVSAPDAAPAGEHSSLPAAAPPLL